MSKSTNTSPPSPQCLILLKLSSHIARAGRNKFSKESSIEFDAFNGMSSLKLKSGHHHHHHPKDGRTMMTALWVFFFSNRKQTSKQAQEFGSCELNSVGISIYIFSLLISTNCGSSFSILFFIFISFHKLTLFA